MLNADLPLHYLYVRDTFLYDGERPAFIEYSGPPPTREMVEAQIASRMTEGCAFGIASVPGRALGFHVRLLNGAMIWRLPIHALAWKRDAPARPLGELELWDAFSEDVSVHTFEHLKEMRVQARITRRSGEPIHHLTSWEWGTYWTTVDWWGTPEADDPGDGGHKVAHIILLDDGNLCAQPNNRLCWHDPATGNPFTAEGQSVPQYQTNTRIWKVEGGFETGEGMFYDVKPRRVVTR